MNMHILSHLSRSLMILLLMLGLASAEDAPRLQQINHAVLSSASEQVTLQLNGSYSPKVFTLKGQSPRIVFDFPGMTQGRGVGNLLKVNGPLVKAVRVGMQNDPSQKTRVVFDLKTLKGVHYSQQFDATTSRLTIRVSGPEKATAKTTTTEKQPPAPAEINGKEQTVAKATPAQASQPVPPLPTEQAAASSKPGFRPETNAEAATAPQAQAKETAGQQPEPSPKAAPKTETMKVEKEAQKQKEKQEAKQTEPTGQATAAKPQEQKAIVPASKAAASQEPPPEVAAEPSAKAETVAPPVSVDPELKSIKFDPASPKGEMVLFKLNGFFPPSVHGVEEGIPRVICDFNNTKLTGSAKNRIKTQGKYVKTIRTSTTKKPAKVRVVIDLEPNRSYDLQQVFFKDDDLFVIIVNTVKK
ncbi:MAG: AMIN domain-containing protein [Desulfobulbus sp.]